MKKILKQNIIKVLILFEVIFIASLYTHIQEVKAATPIFSITSEEVDFEEGSQFIAILNLDTDGAKVEKVDLTIEYNPNILKVIDQDNLKTGVQISEENDLGRYNKNIVTQSEGKIEIMITGEPKQSSDLVLAKILFETLSHGKADVTLNIDKSDLYINGGQKIGYRTTDLVITRIIEDKNNLKILHTQSTYLAEENRPVDIEASLSTDDELLEFKIFYRRIVDGGSFNDAWIEKDLDEVSDGQFKVTIPAEDVKIPGLTYYFKVRTNKRQTTIPRPITLENAYKMRVVTAEEFNDNIPPIITLTPPNSEFQDSIEVRATSNEPNTTIYCSTDNSTPTTSSYLYVEPFIVRETVVIKCFGIDSVGNNGDITTGQYAKLDIPAITASLTANPNQIQIGGNSILSWQTQNATQVSIAPNIGNVEPNGSLQVFPNYTTTYTLFASNEKESIERTATVTILAKKAPPTPTPAPNNPKTGPEHILIIMGVLSIVTVFAMKKA